MWAERVLCRYLKKYMFVIPTYLKINFFVKPRFAHARYYYNTSSTVNNPSANPPRRSNRKMYPTRKKTVARIQKSKKFESSLRDRHHGSSQPSASGRQPPTNLRQIPPPLGTPAAHAQHRLPALQRRCVVSPPPCPAHRTAAQRAPRARHCPVPSSP